MQPKRRTFKMTSGTDEAALGHSQSRREPAGVGGRSTLGQHQMPPPPPSSFSLAYQLQQQQQQALAEGKQQQQVPLGNKDLIIRMLAEIFQVRQDESGQVRWHQVSTSLVPISLYSRTTSKWLDYLLTAPLSIQANDPANTMSPDSRDFLLLLQQFHQQTSRPAGVSKQQQQLRNRNQRAATGANQRQDAIVFQVVGHDFIDGQCRKILNVKIRQPGTRLGQASDYFVYWKDQANGQQHHHNLQHQQFSASSYASNASFMQQSSSMKPPAQTLNPFYPAQQQYDRHQLQQQPLVQFQSSHHQPTWGLNFASMNDAKLFYDICSLNIVNLDFNSEYLKQLSISDGQRAPPPGKQFLTSGSGVTAATMSPCSLMLNQRAGQQRPRNTDQLSQQQRLVRNRNSTRVLREDTLQNSLNTPEGSARRASPIGRQSSISRCPSCRQAFVVDRFDQSAAGRDENSGLGAVAGHSCPVHGQHGTIRARSRSTTRRALSGRGDLENSARARSFSTPASPELDQCPVHQRRHRANTECEVEARERRQTLEYLKRHSKSQQQIGGKLARRDGGPEKPARGFLRSSYLLGSQESFGGNHQRRQQQQQQGAVSSSNPIAQAHEAPSDRLLHGKPVTKTRYLGYLHNVAQQQQLDRRQQLYANQFHGGENPNMTPSGANFEDGGAPAAPEGPPSNRSLFRRTQTGTETFDTFAHRNAQLARAQYAKSRNMKEFLSLDAGGLKPSASFQMGDRFQHRKQIRQPTAAAPTNTANGECRNNNGQPMELYAAKSQQQQQRQQSKSIDESSGAGKSLATKTTPRPVQRRPGSSGAAGDERVTLSGGANVCPAGQPNSGQLAQCNVSTTTEDLPMDSSTRKRMLKLTSDEIISEHTEPRSVSTSTTAIEQATSRPGLETAAAAAAAGQPSRGEKLDLPARAVSLGPPELGGRGDKIRGRGARSDVGRRRSLERSVGVDLDSALPASSFMKHSRLSPLLQSTTASPQQPQDSLDSSGRPPARNLSQTSLDANDDNNRLNAGELSPSRQDDRQIYGMGHYTNRDDSAQFVAQCGMRNGSASGRQVFPDGSCRQQQLATFKSAPDVRRLEGAEQERAAQEGRQTHDPGQFGPLGDECNDFGQLRNSFEALEQEQRQQPCSGSAPRAAPAANFARSNMSSYAVPLCTTVKRPHQQAFVSRRQCHSCPNSLRRKRRPPSTDFQHEVAAGMMADCSDGEPPMAYLPAHMDNCCSYQHFQQQQQQQQTSCLSYQDSFRREPAALSAQQSRLHTCCENNNNSPHRGAAAAVEYANCAHVIGLHDHGCHMEQPLGQQYLDSHWHHQRAIHHHHPSHHQAGAASMRAATRDDLMRDLAHGGGRAGSSACSYEQQQQQAGVENFRRSQANQSSRPLSSQSVRSPMQYGLYESDCDEDISSPAWATQFYGAPDYYVGNNLRQRQHNQPAARLAPDRFAPASVMRPVRGYDQTMSRACLKSRQRSRSQPPGGGADDDDDGDELDGEERNAHHLTKSMENVEKLIREVQSELRALKRQPLGAAHIDMKAAAAAAGANRAPVATGRPSPSALGGQQLQVAEMAQEEDNAEGKQQQQQHEGGQRQLSYTSATRRAGQFKCAGAIRKAGFLSVKKWILKRRQSIELARKQGWRRYWVCLRGTALLFHSVIESKQQERAAGDNNQENSRQRQVDLSSWIRANCSSQLNVMAGLMRSETAGQPSQEALFANMSECYIEEEPRHLIIIDGAIAQPIPEHPRRDFVFCLSTTFGDAYLFQASCQLESDNWISAIHNACAASIARDLIRDEAIKLFETKIRHFELEAEKKLFLRHRLESRLTSMSAMCNVGAAGRQSGNLQELVEREVGRGPGASQQATSEAAGVASPAAKPGAGADTSRTHKTMRALLCQLSQQLLALDSYIEQLHCEIYQMRCYLSSCSAQNIFYHHLLASHHQSASAPNLTSAQSHDLPHPKSLLMHVSKPTKLLLIKLGVFTVSSFHAFIHARQESAKSILESIQQQTSCPPESPLVELRIRSQSISETLMSRPENLQLASETENLIELANLKSIPVVLSKPLFNKIRGLDRGGHHHHHHHQDQSPTNTNEMELDDASDDLYSIQDCGQFVQLNVKLNSNANSSSIIKQVLQLLQPDCNELDFLNYYLRLVVQAAAITTAPDNKAHPNLATKQAADECREEYFVVKRKETLGDWSNYTHIELMEKILFRVNLTKSRMDEEETTAPFGISVEGQLLTSKSESLLNVYCSYIEWGSAADKAGLQDEDEFLMINGVPVGDLDLMFVECIIQDATKLRAVIRSNRCECPARGKRLDQTSWRSLDDDHHDGGAGGAADGERDSATSRRFMAAENNNQSFVSQVISDEYLTSLVCPPPPAKSSAFLRTNTNLLRQKSDLGLDRPEMAADELGDPHELRVASGLGLPKSRSQHLIDASVMNEQASLTSDQAPAVAPSSAVALRSSADLARQLRQKTERISRLLGKQDQANIEPDRSSWNAQISPAGSSSKNADHNQMERLKKSILELIETEYAYIRHLETINEHYMSPLCETSFLNIFDLGSFSQTVVDLLRFQRAFFSLLTRTIFEKIGSTRQEQGEPQTVISDDFERFNWIVQQADAFESVDSFRPLLTSIASAFTSEVDKFKIYASYCVAYSRLQRILHPKNAVANFQGGSAIISIPNSLNVFAGSIGSSNMSGIGHNLTGQHRDMKLFHLIGSSSNGNEDRTTQLKQLAEFLANLDSSSSSASFSLQRSSTSENQCPNQQQQQRSNRGQAKHDSKASSSDGSNDQNEQRLTGSNAYQKNAHHQNFESYLIKPIQRLVKYPMLLNSIALVAQSQPAELFYDEFHTTIKQLEIVINHVNESQRVHDEYGAIFDHIERQFFEQQALDSCKNTVANLFGPHQPPITLNIARLLYSGPVNWLNVEEFTSKSKKSPSLSSVLFVFESCVVFICKEQVKASGRRKQTSKSTNEAQSNQTGQQQQQQQSGGLTSRVLQWSTGASTNVTACGNSEQVNEIVRYQTLIPVSEVQVRSVSGVSGGGSKRTATDTSKKSCDNNRSSAAHFEWELFQCSSSNSNSSLLTKTTTSSSKQQKQQQSQQQAQQQQQLQLHRNSNTGKIYLLSSPSNEERSAFLRKIRFTIRESVRNMSLPTLGSTKSSFSYKSLALKKLSTSSASSATSNTNINTSGSLSPPESSGGPDLMTQDQSTTIKCEPYNTKKVHETSIEVKT